MRSEAVPAARRQTLYFLEEARSVAPVYLDTTVDMGNALAVVDTLRDQGQRVGLNSVLISTIAGAMHDMPEVNLSVTGRIRARQSVHPGVFAKFTLDKWLDGRRIVCSATIPGAERMSLVEIQTYIDFHKSADVARAPCFRQLRLLQKLPTALGYRLYRRVLGSPVRRAAIHGSFALTSLAHRSVSGFYPITGGTMTFGTGHVADMPMVVDGAIVVRPALRLCLAFDHRAIDGALASEFLDRVKRNIESVNAEHGPT